MSQLIVHWSSDWPFIVQLFFFFFKYKPYEYNINLQLALQPGTYPAVGQTNYEYKIYKVNN